MGSPYCRNCRLFRGIRADAPAEARLDVAPDERGAVVTGTVKITLDCRGCGAELARHTFPAFVRRVPLAHAPTCPGPRLQLAEQVFRFDRRGRVQFKQRSAHIYGAEADLNVSCLACGAEGTGRWEDDTKASKMDGMPVDTPFVKRVLVNGRVRVVFGDKAQVDAQVAAMTKKAGEEDR